MTLDIGSTVRLLVEAIASDGTLLPENSRGMVIGHEGPEKVVVEFHDQESDTRSTVAVFPWEIRK